ncbi:SMP-30/gluconolactonase/LRE family protein [Echinicola rosea]|uniref:SMP-30/Gluconolactonase/LRE-like region domain-containing protein n=1 Tax=Echinicola rosea TaxID=1807691 RepID=A0ABQ1V3D7_9BACT|nr:SMP-30/gluconolactonase/LRE family protein [Echinicola rosea]GGF36460.1 hypothetical protein GCM10011339_26240 [Echinicola rosea]
MDSSHLFLEHTCELGEGIFYDGPTASLFWVDIDGQMVYRYSFAASQTSNWHLPGKVGTIAPYPPDSLLVSLDKEIGYLNLSDGEYTQLIELETTLHANRFNDGKCDPHGNFWFGSMHLPERLPTGHLYCLDRKGMVRKQLSDITVSNGLTWDQRKNKFYFIDSPTRSIFSFDYHDGATSLHNRQTVIKVPSQMGFPDGMTIDENGLLYIALWGGYGVGIWDPENGQLVDKIPVDAPLVTSCAFGDKDQKGLYISTARKGLGQDVLAKYPLSGGIFYARCETKGMPAFPYLRDASIPNDHPPTYENG